MAYPPAFFNRPSRKASFAPAIKAATISVKVAEASR